MKIYPTGIDFRPSSRRVVVRPFIPSDSTRLKSIMSRALSLSDSDIEKWLAITRADFSERHINLDSIWLRHFEKVRSAIPEDRVLGESRRLFIGSIFSGEYALESAALFNPSIVAHPDQTRLADGDLRFVLSLRATGEGHVSSIEFRSGIVHRDHSIEMETPTPFVTLPDVDPNPTFHKTTFLHKLSEMGLENGWALSVLGRLGKRFTLRELDQSIEQTTQDESLRHGWDVQRTLECMRWLAESNYQIHFGSSSAMSERIIFPVSPNESNGIEDARFVRFVDDDGSVIYYATYTAYNGRAILPQLIETTDFFDFRVLTQNGKAVQNKGMALFPRRINGRYAMLSRRDDENLFLMYSEHPHFWNDSQLLEGPTLPWEIVKLGNCGSPIETEAGWLVITHGVGPMRKYSMGAILLDLHDPSKVIGRMRDPLLQPEGAGREGYVPNVVYSCGALVHNGRLVLPYGLSDSASTIVTMDLNELLAMMVS